MSKKLIFTNNDYNSNDGMMTAIWGPSLWHTLHTISFNYPVKPTKEDKDNYIKFINSLENVLPCRYCRDNLKTNLKATRFNRSVMKNRETFSKWVYDLHNHVNKMLNKKKESTFDEIRDRYENFRSRCVEPKTKLNRIKNKKENGCITPLYGVKSKCVLNIVPKEKKCKTLNIDSKCKLKRIKNN